MTSLLVAGVVVVLLPLATPELQLCVQSVTKQLLTKKGVVGGIFVDFYQNHFWNVASAGLRFTPNRLATEIIFEKPTDTEIDAIFDYQKTGFREVKQIFKLDGRDPKTAHFVDVDNSEKVYFFECAKKFVGGYRCLSNAQSAKSDDPECFIWAEWGTLGKDVTPAVLAECESAFKGLPNCANKFTRSFRSDGK